MTVICLECTCHSGTCVLWIQSSESERMIDCLKLIMNDWLLEINNNTLSALSMSEK